MFLTVDPENAEPSCSCTPPPYGDGPEIDCPVHGVTCGCGRPIGLHEVGEIVTTGHGEHHTYWAKACLDATQENAESWETGDVVRDANGATYERNVRYIDRTFVWRTFGGGWYQEDYPVRPLARMIPEVVTPQPADRQETP